MTLVNSSAEAGVESPLLRSNQLSDITKNSSHHHFFPTSHGLLRYLEAMRNKFDGVKSSLGDRKRLKLDLDSDVAGFLSSSN